VTAAGRIHVVTACTLLLGVYTHPVAAWYLWEPWRRTPRRAAGASSIEGLYILQKERVISQPAAVSSLQKFVAQQIFKSTQFINAWEQILATLHG